MDSFGLIDVSFIKIDVEGHKKTVLAESRETIASNHPVVLVEAEDRHNPGAPGRVAEWFAGLDYDGFFIKARRLLPVAKLLEADTDPAGLSGGVYINNFLYLPREDGSLVEQIRQATEK